MNKSYEDILIDINKQINVGDIYPYISRTHENPSTGERIQFIAKVVDVKKVEFKRVVYEFIKDNSQ